MRYADLRRKIGNMYYFPLESGEENAQPEFKTDREALSRAPTREASAVVTHNTLTIPLDELLEEAQKTGHGRSRAAANTQELKKIDEPRSGKTKRRFRDGLFGRESMGYRKPRSRHPALWVWIIVGLLCAGLAVAIIVLALVYS